MLSVRASTRLRHGKDEEKQSYCKLKRKRSDESTNQKETCNKSTNRKRRYQESTSGKTECAKSANRKKRYSESTHLESQRSLHEKGERQKKQKNTLDEEDEMSEVKDIDHDEKVINRPNSQSKKIKENNKKQEKLPVETDHESTATTTTTTTRTTTKSTTISPRTEDTTPTTNHNSDDVDRERYLKILCRLYPHQSPRILELILKGCNNDVIEAIESILPTHIHTGKEWVPRDYACGSFPRQCDCGCEETVCSCGQTHEIEISNEYANEDSVDSTYSRDPWSYLPQMNSDRLTDFFGLGVRPWCFHGYGWGCGCLGRGPLFQNVYFPHCY